MEYNAIQEMDREQVESAILKNDPEELLRAVLSAAIYSSDPDWAEGVCLRLADHEHFNVRGNAILGFAHIARIHEHLDENHVRPIIQSGFSDESEYVRGQANAAADDIEHFLRWRFVRPKSSEE